MPSIIGSKQQKFCLAKAHGSNSTLSAQVALRGRKEQMESWNFDITRTRMCKILIKF